MTRLAVAAAAFLALFTVMAQEASALTVSTRQCVNRERRASRDALRTLRAQEQSTLLQKIASCCFKPLDLFSGHLSSPVP